MRLRDASSLWYTSNMSHSMAISQQFMVPLGARGRFVLPAPVRKALGLQEGDRLIVTMEEPGIVRLTSARQAARQGRGIFKSHSGERLLTDELLRERREEAQRG